MGAFEKRAPESKSFVIKAILEKKYIVKGKYVFSAVGWGGGLGLRGGGSYLL